jgi:hypothetical protein
MSGVAIGVAAAAAVAGVGVSAMQGADQADAAKKSMQQAQANADRTAAQADQDFNRANQKKPDTSAILSAAQQAGKGGQSGTMLTGAQGVDPSALTLGKSTLLGS